MIMELNNKGSTVIIVCHDELLLKNFEYNEITFEKGLLNHA